MEYPSNQMQYGVVEASRLVTELVLAHRNNQTAGTTNEAIRRVARECSISPAQVRRLYQPSRAPKDVGVGVWHRIYAAYRRYLERQLRGLEQYLRRMDALGDLDPGTAADLATEAENLIRRIKHHL
jgi:hypothetical protein